MQSSWPRFGRKKKRSRARINTHEGKLLNKEYLDEVEAEEARVKDLKEKNKRKKQLQAECKSLWKLTSLFTTNQRRRNKTRSAPQKVPTPSTTGSQIALFFLHYRNLEIPPALMAITIPDLQHQFGLQDQHQLLYIKRLGYAESDWIKKP